MAPTWPFGKKKLNADRLPFDGPWTVAEGQHSGRVMIVRSNMAYREFGRVAGYEHQVGIAVPLKHAETTGLPSPEETSQLDEIEDLVCASLQDHAESLLVAVISTSGMREFVFYTREPQQVRERFEQLRIRITGHEMQLMIQSDAKWEIYAQFASPGRK